MTTIYNATNRPNKLMLTGQKDINGKAIREGNVLINKNNLMASVVVFSEFTKQFGLLPLCCFKDMSRTPNIREMYLGDLNGIGEEIIKWWNLMVVGHIDEKNTFINNSSLFLGGEYLCV